MHVFTAIPQYTNQKALSRLNQKLFQMDVDAENGRLNKTGKLQRKAVKDKLNEIWEKNGEKSDSFTRELRLHLETTLKQAAKQGIEIEFHRLYHNPTDIITPSRFVPGSVQVMHGGISLIIGARYMP